MINRGPWPRMTRYDGHGILEIPGILQLRKIFLILLAGEPILTPLLCAIVCRTGLQQFRELENPQGPSDRKPSRHPGKAIRISVEILAFQDLIYT